MDKGNQIKGEEYLRSLEIEYTELKEKVTRLAIQAEKGSLSYSQIHYFHSLKRKERRLKERITDLGTTGNIFEVKVNVGFNQTHNVFYTDVREEILAKLVSRDFGPKAYIMFSKEIIPRKAY